MKSTVKKLSKFVTFPKSTMLNIPNLSIDQNNGDYD